LDVWNTIAGIEIKRAGVAHAVFYTYEKFRVAVETNKYTINKPILTDLCLLFGANIILGNSVPAV